MKHVSISKNILLLMLFGLSGCITFGKAPATSPATLAEIKNETQRLQETLTLQYKQFTQQQTDMTAQLNAELKDMRNTLNTLNRTIHTRDETRPAPIEISDEQCPPLPPGQTPDGKLLLGETEWIWLDAADRAFQARVDTGADTSSISATDITIFERNSKKWVRFYMVHRDMAEPLQFEAPLVRRVRVRQASTKTFDRRLVVRLAMRIGNHNEKSEFTLTDRSKMKYPVMLGRDFLKDIAVVDVALKYIQPKPRLKDAR